MIARALLLSIAMLSQGVVQAQEREDLRIEAPATWGTWKKASEQQGSGVHFTAWVPENQQGAAWTESIALAILDPRPSGDAAVNAIRLVLSSDFASCLNSNVVPPKPNTEGIFTVAYVQFYCTQNRRTGVGEVKFIKSISSERRVYLVAMMRRVKPFEIPSGGGINFAQDQAIEIFDWMKTTSTYLSETVRLCVSGGDRQETCSP